MTPSQPWAPQSRPFPGRSPSALPLPRSQPAAAATSHAPTLFAGKLRHGVTSRELLECGRVKVPLPGASVQHCLPFMVLPAQTQAFSGLGAATWGLVQAPANQQGSSPPLGDPFPEHRPWIQKPPRGEGAAAQLPPVEARNQTRLRGTDTGVQISHRSDTLLYIQTQQGGHN